MRSSGQSAAGCPTAGACRWPRAARLTLFSSHGVVSGTCTRQRYPLNGICLRSLPTPCPEQRRLNKRTVPAMPLSPHGGGTNRAPHCSFLGCAHTGTHVLLGSGHFFILAQNSSRDDCVKDESPNTIAKTHP